MVKANDPYKVFETRVIRSTEEDCWGFAGSHNPQGYPMVWISGKQRKVSHVALEVTGRPRPSQRALALHSCDNPSCVNPSHLRWGTHKDNAQDRIERTGYNMPRGEDNHRWVRTDSVVKDLLSLAHLTAAEAGRIVGVSKPTVLKVWSEHGVAKRKAAPRTTAQARLLEYLRADGREWVPTSITQISADLGMHGPNVHRALHELLGRGLVEKRSPRPRAISEWKVRVA